MKSIIRSILALSVVVMSIVMFWLVPGINSAKNTEYVRRYEDTDRQKETAPADTTISKQLHKKQRTEIAKGEGRTFDDRVITDSASTMLIPYRYEARFFASNKAMTWGNYFANFIVYDFKNDSYRKLFPQDTYIQAPQTDYYIRPANTRLHYPYISKKWIFYLVRNTDYSQNGKIDDNDPLILFVSDRQGAGLRSLTPEHESIVGLELYESLGFALLNVQRDENKDREFKSEDNDRYLLRLNLSDLSFGNPIESGTGK